MLKFNIFYVKEKQFLNIKKPFLDTHKNNIPISSIFVLPAYSIYTYVKKVEITQLQFNYNSSQCKVAIK